MTVLIIAVLLGIAGRTLVPYLQEVVDNPGTTFDRSFLLPPIFSLLIGLIISPLVLSAIPPEALNNVTLQGLAGVFASAWGLTDIVRSGQKVGSKIVDTVKVKVGSGQGGA